ncbi:MAG: ATP-dependent DNA helicase RecG [Erysipelotrichia bacterium]|nr:ATP-dependent DNA helicase RecG [Erysipelotrichia bacterium]
MNIKITPKKKEALEKLNLYSVRDILTYYPARYEKLEYIDPRNWQDNTQIIIEGVIFSKVKIAYFANNKSVLNFDIQAENDLFHITAFNQPWLIRYKIADKITVIGKYQGKQKILATKINKIPLSEQIGIKPVYILKGLLTDKYFSELIEQILETYREKIDDFVPEYLRIKYDYYDEYTALKYIHRPTNDNELVKAINTLKYTEFLQFNLLMNYRKKENTEINQLYCKKFSSTQLNMLIKSLPFTLTEQQHIVLQEILNDLSADKQMQRLLQGDVGCGKTIIAFIAMYAVSLSGMQAAMMAPTEILAKQHYQNLREVFSGFSVETAVLYSGQNSAERKENLNKINSGQAQLIIGTHSLFQEEVTFPKLGLVITDEQHRFGVLQRAALSKKGPYCDILLMSATPIPRTLAASLYGDLDVSTITSSANPHKKIHTFLIKENGFFHKIDEIENLLAQKNQMYVVCPLVDKGDELTRNVTETYEKLKKYFSGRYNVGLLHGQMDSAQKMNVQEKFAAGDIDILVCTTIIEVGIDVKNANIMIIYDANRFGLAQLHQLRGRVGRGQKEGYCYLLTGSLDEQTIDKLNIIVNNDDGFKISYYDLKLRGPGDILGVRQSGLPVFMLGNVINDADLLELSKQDSDELMNHLDDYPLIKKYLENKDNDCKK